MDWIIWVIVIVLIVGVVWWLLNRNSRGDTAGANADKPATEASATEMPQMRRTENAPSGRGASSSTQAAASSAGTAAGGAIPASAPEQAAAEQAAPARGAQRSDEEWAEAPAPDGGDVDDWDANVEPTRKESAASGLKADEDKAEWEAQWSEGSSTSSAVHPGVSPAHRPEYTEPHAPTLPGAESAAAESAADEESSTPASSNIAGTEEPAELDPDAETRQRAESSAVSEDSMSHTAEPSGHLASEQPYGEGSAAAAVDGSGPAGYTVKGDAETMTYYEETSPAYEGTRAGVWFESVAHAEAAGFRPPRRTRL